MHHPECGCLTCTEYRLAVALDAAHVLRAKLAEAERQRDEAVKLLREWLNGHCSGIIRRDLTERTEAYIAGVQHG